VGQDHDEVTNEWVGDPNQNVEIGDGDLVRNHQRIFDTVIIVVWDFQPRGAAEGGTIEGSRRHWAALTLAERERRVHYDGQEYQPSRVLPTKAHPIPTRHLQPPVPLG
jgi:hypothetical protein